MRKATATQVLAAAFGSGQTTAAEVVASAKAGIKARTPSEDNGYERNTYDWMMARMNNDDFTELNNDGWDGVVSVYNSGGLSHVQYAELHSLYTGK